MIRKSRAPRVNWKSEVESQGLIWHTTGSDPYWDESAYYSFTRAEVATLTRATEELYQLFLEAGQSIIDRNLFAHFAIPDFCVPLIREAWEAEPPALNYGRFDLGFDGVHPPKLFEFNCDTPTSLLEAAVVQWSWKQEVFPHCDQFNRIHDALVEQWRAIAPRIGNRAHFSHIADDAGEDTITTSYMRDIAEEAGVESLPILMADIGWNSITNRFVDLDEQPIDALYHLYPWEWLVRESFGDNIARSIKQTNWIEPIWKMIWSNKAILAVLWELFPDHPNLLPAFINHFDGDHVRKPILAREGANISIVRGNAVTASSEGDYGAEGFVHQALYDLPGEGNNRPVIGAWIVDGAAAGIGIREDGPITGNTARFVPHVIEG
jgi:glutathionylspermidine synthase